MKIKPDFVTNSSTASFVVMGIRVEMSDVSTEFSDLYEYLSQSTKDSDLSFSFGDPYGYGDEAMVGIKYTKMGDNETLSQFKERVTNQLRDHLNLKGEPEVGHIEEGWSDR